MTQRFRLTIAQLNATVGDLAGNAAQALEAWSVAKSAGSDMVMLPEMFVTGYQVQDLVLKPEFTRDAMAQIQGLAQSCDEGPAMGIGGSFRDETGLYNAYYILHLIAGDKHLGQHNHISARAFGEFPSLKRLRRIASKITHCCVELRHC